MRRHMAPSLKNPLASVSVTEEAARGVLTFVALTPISSKVMRVEGGREARLHASKARGEGDDDDERDTC